MNRDRYIGLRVFDACFDMPGDPSKYERGPMWVLNRGILVRETVELFEEGGVAGFIRDERNGIANTNYLEPISDSAREDFLRRYLSKGPKPMMIVMG